LIAHLRSTSSAGASWEPSVSALSPDTQTLAFRKATGRRYTELLAPLITLMLPGTPPPQCMNPAAVTQTDKRLVGDGGSGGGFDYANDRLDLARR